MKPEEQRIAIAEACGRNGWWCPQCKKLVSEYSLGYQNRHANCTDSARQSPNYPTDLNAMREAVMSLSNLQQRNFIAYLTGCSHQWETLGIAQVLLVATATAAQLAEAFLRAIGKWRDA